MKRIISFAILGLLLFSCTKENRVEPVLTEISNIEEANGGWGAIWADATGAWAGGGFGAKVGMFLGGPHGSIIGGMLGAVGGGAAGSITYANNCHCLTVPTTQAGWNSINVLNVPPHSATNSSSEVGILHNLVMYDLLKSNHQLNDYENFYRIFEYHILNRQSFGIKKLPIQVKTELKILYNDIVSSNPKSTYIVGIENYFGNLNVNFASKLDTKLLNTTSTRELNTLSVLEYTKYFWSKF